MHQFQKKLSTQANIRQKRGKEQGEINATKQVLKILIAAIFTYVMILCILYCAAEEQKRQEEQFEKRRDYGATYSQES